VFDLNGDGFGWRGTNARVTGDFDGNGVIAQSTWINSNDGLLVFDQNGDGIGVRGEWVLTRFIQGAKTDLEALRGFDTNSDGVFDANDAQFAQFKVGRDLNQNGIFDSGELTGLAQFGITAIRTESGITPVGTVQAPWNPVEGVDVYNYGQFVRSDGSVGTFADAAFSRYDLPTSFENHGSFVVGRQGLKSTYVVNNGVGISISLTSYNDFLGSSAQDWVYGDGRANAIYGGSGTDVMYGGDGDDTVVADTYDLSYGAADGGAGNDALIIDDAYGVSIDAYARGFETVYGGSGNDYFYSSFNTFNYDQPYDGSTSMFGGDGNDTFVGGAGHEVMIGGAGADSFQGGGGNDTIIVDEFDNVAGIRAGVSYADRLVIGTNQGLYISNLHTLEFEEAYGGGGSDTIYASRSDSNYWQEKNTNVLSGGAGNDYLYGGAGSDTYIWNLGGGNDTFVDRDYGEYMHGDIISLGAGITANEVTISWGQNPAIVISGPQGGTISVRGFGLSGPRDMLMVDGKAYDLTGLVTPSGGYGTLYVNQMTPVSFGTSAGSGGGGTGGGGTGGGGGNPIPPVVLDLDGDGFELIAYKGSKARFDWDGDGRRDKTGWVSPDDAFLVLDRNGDGMITEANEVSFGTRGEEGTFVSDLEGLRIFDTNKNDSLDVGDADFSRFGVWQDLDSDGISDPGELKGVLEVGLEALALTAFRTGDPIVAKQNTIYATSDAVFSDGSSIKIADALLAFKDRYHSGHKGSEGAFVEAEVPMTPAVYMNGVRDIFSEHFAIA
jgi:Ca2+-binding RTX toxin-like protein